MVYIFISADTDGQTGMKLILNLAKFGDWSAIRSCIMLNAFGGHIGGFDTSQVASMEGTNTTMEY